MPGFDPEIGKLAQRVLINPRKIDYHTGVFATKVQSYCLIFTIPAYKVCWLCFSIFWKITPAKDGKPVTIELTDAKTKELKDTLEVTHVVPSNHFHCILISNEWMYNPQSPPPNHFVKQSESTSSVSGCSSSINFEILCCPGDLLYTSIQGLIELVKAIVTISVLEAFFPL